MKTTPKQNLFAVALMGALAFNLTAARAAEPITPAAPRTRGQVHPDAPALPAEGNAAFDPRRLVENPGGQGSEVTSLILS